MPINSNHNIAASRRNTLELEGGQVMASDEQIRQHCSELFGATFYLNRLSEALESMKFSPKGVLKSHLDEEGQQKLDACVSHLTEAMQEAFSQIPFEFTVQQASDEEEELPVTRNRDFTVAVSNAEMLFKSVEQPVKNLEVLHDVSDLIDALEKRIKGLEESLANPSPREKNSIERSEIEIRVLQDELNDFNEFEKTGKPTTFQRNQKKQLKDNLEKHRGIIRKIHAKARRKKGRIASTQQTLSQAVALFTEFLAQYNPETSTNFSAGIDLTKTLNDNGINTNDVSSELNRILQVKRKGDYTAYYLEVESRQKWDDRKLLLGRFRDRFRRWAPQLVVILAVAGGVYAERDRIAEFFTPTPSASTNSSYNSPLSEDLKKALGIPTSGEEVEQMSYEERRRIMLQSLKGEELAYYMGLNEELEKTLTLQRQLTEAIETAGSKDAFMQHVNNPLLTDEALSTLLINEPDNKTLELTVKKVRIFRAVEMSDADSDLIFYSSSSSELDKRLAQVLESLSLDQVSDLTKRINNNKLTAEFADLNDFLGDISRKSTETSKEVETSLNEIIRSGTEPFDLEYIAHDVALERYQFEAEFPVLMTLNGRFTDALFEKLKKDIKITHTLVMADKKQIARDFNSATVVISSDAFCTDENTVYLNISVSGSRVYKFPIPLNQLRGQDGNTPCIVRIPVVYTGEHGKEIVSPASEKEELVSKKRAILSEPIFNKYLSDEEKAELNALDSLQVIDIFLSVKAEMITYKPEFLDDLKSALKSSSFAVILFMKNEPGGSKIFQISINPSDLEALRGKFGEGIDVEVSLVTDKRKLNVNDLKKLTYRPNALIPPEKFCSSHLSIAYRISVPQLGDGFYMYHAQTVTHDYIKSSCDAIPDKVSDILPVLLR